MKTDFLSDLSVVIIENEPLGPHTYLRVGGPARWFARPRSVGDACELIRRCRQEGVEYLPLGLGANLLVSDEGVDAMVIRLSEPAFQIVQWGCQDGGEGYDPATVKAAAGADMHRLVLDAVRGGFGGLERLAGIPGTVGGILRMNAAGANQGPGSCHQARLEKLSPFHFHAAAFVWAKQPPRRRDDPSDPPDRSSNRHCRSEDS